jgi:DNA topoisomerase IB
LNLIGEDLFTKPGDHLMSLCLVFERWEEERYPEGIKWKFLEHKGPVFAPPYEPLPESVKFYYDGELFQVV